MHFKCVLRASLELATLQTAWLSHSQLQMRKGIKGGEGLVHGHLAVLWQSEIRMQACVLLTAYVGLQHTRPRSRPSLSALFPCGKALPGPSSGGGLALLVRNVETHHCLATRPALSHCLSLHRSRFRGDPGFLPRSVCGWLCPRNSESSLFSRCQ